MMRSGGSTCIRAAYVSICQHRSGYQRVVRDEEAAKGGEVPERREFAQLAEPRVQRQYLYFCSSKASKFGIYLVVGYAKLRHVVQVPYVSIRQHTSAYVSIRQQTLPGCRLRQAQSCCGGYPARPAGAAGVSIRQHTSAYVSIRQHTSAYVSTRLYRLRQHTSAYVSIRQHKSAYVSIRQHTSAYVSTRSCSLPSY
jgi:hypothetical protein